MLRSLKRLLELLRKVSENYGQQRKKNVLEIFFKKMKSIGLNLLDQKVSNILHKAMNFIEKSTLLVLFIRKLEKPIRQLENSIS